MVFLLLPPFAFIIYLLAGYAISALTTLLSAKGNELFGKEKAYACGECSPEHRVQPDFRQFFPFAVFFTIMHVIVLVIATAPSGSLLLPLVYLGAAVLAIFILFRR